MTLRVLAVDDCEVVTSSLAILLDRWGYEVRTAPSGETALSVAQDFRPDVVISDLVMPRMDGFEVARQLRRDQTGKLTIICLSSIGTPACRRRTKEAGFDHHLVKPADPAKLRQLLQSC
jgi:CheY-like chemotaxis protein